MPQNKTVEFQLSSMPCNLCGNVEVSVLATRSRYNTPLRTVICQDCGLVWCDPFPYNPRQFYEKDYRIEYKKTYAPKPKHILRAGMVALTRYEKIKNLLVNRQTILDVGTGGGEFAYLLKSLGYDLHGIEPNKIYAEYTVAEYELNLQIGFIQDSQFNQESFDLITIWHVLEHTEDPCFVLGKLQSLLKPQGILVVEVPNIEAICQAPKSTFHEAHLFNFNLDTLTKLGEKAGLIADSHLFSEDGGNVTVFFRKAANERPIPESWDIIDNADRIAARVKGHTNLKHYTSPRPYRRLLGRLFRAAYETISIRSCNDNRRLLDRLYNGIETTSES